MTQDELNTTIKNKYVNMGLDAGTADRLLNSNYNPASASMRISEQEQTKISGFDNIKITAPFSLVPPTPSKERKENAVAITRVKKEDLIDALLGFLTMEDMKTVINTDSVQQGKAGAIMFKNLNNDYFTLKLTLNKTKPADYNE